MSSPRTILAGRLRNVGWIGSLATRAPVKFRTNSGPAPSGGLNNDKPPTCRGCSRDSASRYSESVGTISSIHPLDPASKLVALVLAQPGPALSQLGLSGALIHWRSHAFDGFRPAGTH